MNVAALIFLIICATTVVTLPRRWAAIPLFASCFYVTLGQGVELGPISLPIYRLVLAAGLLRCLVRRETVAGGANAIDKLVIAMIAWIVFASFFHERVEGAGPIYASGFVYNIGVVYLLSRTWCRNLAELEDVLRIVAWLLVPVAISMAVEHMLMRNFFRIVFEGEGWVYLRDGRVRAMGPFAHPILAGTVGSVCFPLFCGIWKRFPFSAKLGLISCLVIVVSSTSSGPLMSLVIGVFGILLWFRRSWVRWIRLGLIALYLLAEVVMERPAYYLISKIDLTGSSTGWHRSRLIERALDNLDQWWLFGTDRTVHWMGLAVDEAGRHSDITNYYIWIGVIGGLPATLLLIAILWRVFACVGNAIRNLPADLAPHGFMIWCLGAGMLAHAVTSLSVSYTDQSLTFFWLNIAAISSVGSLLLARAPNDGSLKKSTSPPIGRQARISGRLRTSRFLRSPVGRTRISAKP